MAKAWQLAVQANAEGEVPVGAVVVSDDNTILGSACNQVIRHQDPTAHAEILAIRQAALRLGNYRLENCTLYTTLEPCAMCAGAMVQARIKRVVFACRDFKAGAAGSAYNLLKGYPFNHQVTIDEGIMQQECSRLLQAFFSQRR